MEIRVMKFLIAALFLVFSHAATAQKEVPLADLKAHVGDTIVTCGTVSSAYYAIKAKNSPTFLNIGGRYPNQLLTIVIWEHVRSKFKIRPEEYFFGKEVCISGKIELFESRPQVVINNQEQIKIVENKE